MKETTWTLLKSAMNKSTTQNALPEYVIIDNNNVQDKHDIVNKFNTSSPILARILARILVCSHHTEKVNKKQKSNANNKQ